METPELNFSTCSGGSKNY